MVSTTQAVIQTSRSFGLTGIPYLKAQKVSSQVPPHILTAKYPGAEFKELSRIRLSSDQKLSSGVFVMVGPLLECLLFTTS